MIEVPFEIAILELWEPDKVLSLWRALQNTYLIVPRLEGELGPALQQVLDNHSVSVRVVQPRYHRGQ